MAEVAQIRHTHVEGHQEGEYEAAHGDGGLQSPLSKVLPFEVRDRLSRAQCPLRAMRTGAFVGISMLEIVNAALFIFFL